MSTLTQAVTLTGTQTIVIPSGGKSISIVVTKGQVNMDLTGTGCNGTAIPIPSGMNLTYAVEGTGQNIRCDVTFTGQTVNTSAVIIQTRS